MLEKIETKVEELKGLLAEAKPLQKALAKHGFELSVKAITTKPRKRKAKKQVETSEAPAPKKKAAKKKAAKTTEVEDTEF